MEKLKIGIMYIFNYMKPGKLNGSFKRLAPNETREIQDELKKIKDDIKAGYIADKSIFKQFGTYTGDFHKSDANLKKYFGHIINYNPDEMKFSEFGSNIAVYAGKRLTPKGKTVHQWFKVQ